MRETTVATRSFDLGPLTLPALALVLGACGSSNQTIAPNPEPAIKARLIAGDYIAPFAPINIALTSSSTAAEPRNARAIITSPLGQEIRQFDTNNRVTFYPAGVVGTWSFVCVADLDGKEVRSEPQAFSVPLRPTADLVVNAINGEDFQLSLKAGGEAVTNNWQLEVFAISAATPVKILGPLDCDTNGQIMLTRSMLASPNGQTFYLAAKDQAGRCTIPWCPLPTFPVISAVAVNMGVNGCLAESGSARVLEISGPFVNGMLHILDPNTQAWSSTPFVSSPTGVTSISAQIPNLPPGFSASLLQFELALNTNIGTVVSSGVMPVVARQ